MGESNISIHDAIIGGEFDDELDDIIETITVRKREISRRKLRDFKAGDRVKVVGGIRPKYLVGVTGVVEGRTTTRVEVALDFPAGRFPSGTAIGFPPGTLALIETEDAS